MARERHDAAFIVGAILGGLAGAGYTLFQAPQAGAQTRAQLAEQVAWLTGRLRTAASPLVERSQALGQQATATVSTLTERRSGGTSEATSGSTEPFILLPDPLEPYPVVLADAAPATGADAPVPGAPTVGGLPAGDDLDLVIDGPRPAGPDR